MDPNVKKIAKNEGSFKGTRNPHPQVSTLKGGGFVELRGIEPLTS